MAYCDYLFYTDFYYGNSIAETDFPRLAERASDYIRAATGGISDRVDGAALDAVKKCTCAIAEVFQYEGRMSSRAFSGKAALSSQTVGGWTKSYQSAAVSGAEVEYLDGRKRDALEMYLSALPEFGTLFGVRSYRCGHLR